MLAIATVGTFDGCHRGHRAVLDTLRREASARGLDPLVITFTNHPLEVVRPEAAPDMLQLPDDKKHDLQSFALPVLMLTFTPELCSLTAEQWMRRMRDDMHIKALVLGYDNTFGSDGRRLSHKDYIELGRRLGIEVIQAPRVGGCSSSAVRKALRAGDADGAAAILGHPYKLRGSVGEGDRIGRRLDAPTANLIPCKGLLIPADGVYAAMTEVPGEGCFRSVVNIGRRPSLDARFGNDLRIETHLIDYTGNLYGRDIAIHFCHRLRGEIKFPDLEALRRAIAVDVEQTRRYFAGSSPAD